MVYNKRALGARYLRSLTLLVRLQDEVLCFFQSLSVAECDFQVAGTPVADFGDVSGESVFHGLLLGVELKPDGDLLGAGPNAGEVLDATEALVVLELLEGDVVSEGHEVCPEFFVEVFEVQFRLLLWAILAAKGGPNTGSGRTLTMPEPKTKDFMPFLVQLLKGTA
jgi:hypothetical protein